MVIGAAWLSKQGEAGAIAARSVGTGEDRWLTGAITGAIRARSADMAISGVGKGC